MKEVATRDAVGVLAGKSRGGKHPLCVRFITVGKVAVCKKKEAHKYIQDLIYTFHLYPLMTLMNTELVLYFN